MMNGIQYFQYGDQELDHLRRKDAALGKVIDELGFIEREVIPDMFMALVNSIIGQQISTKAQKTVWDRFQVLFYPVTAEHVNELSAEELQTCGISMRKACYIKEIAGSIAEGRLNLAELTTMTDEEVCKRLSQIKGIGVWTAEMLMTFSLQRPDVISEGDLAIIRGMRMLYHHRKITPALFARYKRRYSPYATVASLYLWAIAGGACEGMKDYGGNKK